MPGVIYKIKNKFGNSLLYPIWKMLHNTEAQALRSNTQYKNIHKGERCFILGNGPSLKLEQLDLLEDEYVFTVNQFARSEQVRSVRPNYHFWADPIFFKDEGSDASKEIVKTMIDVGQYNSDFVSFFPINEMDFVQRNGIDKKIHTGYFYSPLSLESGMINNIDYSKFTPGFGTVVQWCITMAIYMGFKEIYLLGCDHTGLMVQFKTALRKMDETEYAYKYSDVEKKRMEDMVDKQGMEVLTFAYYNSTVEYRLLYEFCKKKNINLVNCSSVTVIDSIPRMRLTDVFNK